MSRKTRRKNRVRIVFTPVTPAGTELNWLESKTEEEAWNALLKDASHMPYKNKEELVERGYTVISEKR
ncbi:MAG TPA: hypothetical protein VFM18_20165 [Methanosarcina sp.]|nr:hypothetical protein [Methanosarcina sp.]